MKHKLYRTHIPKFVAIRNPHDRYVFKLSSLLTALRSRLYHYPLVLGHHPAHARHPREASLPILALSCFAYRVGLIPSPSLCWLF